MSTSRTVYWFSWWGCFLPHELVDFEVDVIEPPMTAYTRASSTQVQTCMCFSHYYRLEIIILTSPVKDT